MNDEPAGADGVVDLLGLVGAFADLVAAEAGRGVVDPCPFFVDGFSQAGGDLGGDAFGVQSVGRLLGPVRLLAVDPGPVVGSSVGARAE